MSPFLDNIAGPYYSYAAAPLSCIMAGALIFCALRSVSVQALTCGEEVPWEDTTFRAPAVAASQLKPDIFSHILRCDFGSDRKTRSARGMRAKCELSLPQ